MQWIIEAPTTGRLSVSKTLAPASATGPVLFMPKVVQPSQWLESNKPREDHDTAAPSVIEHLTVVRASTYS